MKLVSTVKLLAAVAMGAFFASSASAAPTTIDFENYSGTFITATAISGGYTFTPSAGNLALLANGSSCGPNCAANGTETLIMGGSQGTPFAAMPMRMVNTGGSNFYLRGFDFAEFYQGGSASSLVVVGNKFGGGTISQTFAIDGLNDGPGGNNDFQGAALSSLWGSTLLTSVDFSGFLITQQMGFQLDNVVVDNTANVPEPASLALVGLGLVGMAMRRRKLALA